MPFRLTGTGFALLVFTFSGAAFAEHALEGRWAGEIVDGAASTPFEFQLDRVDGEWRGLVTFPRSGTRDYAVDALDVKRKKVTATYKSDEQQRAFELELKDRRLVGAFMFGDDRMDCTLAPVAETLPYTTEELTFRNGGVELAATLYLPNGPGPHPALVRLHGSGDYNERWRFRFWGDFYTRQGFAFLAFDKRGVGESTGNWREVGFEPLARDGIAGVETLKERKDVDASRIGMCGISQAGWIMVLAASLSDDVRFLVVESGATYDVETEGYFDYEVMLEDKGFSRGDIAKALDVMKRNNQVTRTGEGYDELMAYVREVRDEAWYKELGLFIAPADSFTRNFYRGIIDFDPAPHLRRIDIPILWLYGLEDKSVDARPCIEILNEIESESDKDYTIVEFPGANHGLRVPPDPAKDAAPLAVYPDELLPAIEKFLNRFAN